MRRKRDEVEMRNEEKDIYLFVIFKLNVTVVLCGWSIPLASCRWDGHVILSHCIQDGRATRRCLGPFTLEESLIRVNESESEG